MRRQIQFIGLLLALAISIALPRLAFAQATCSIAASAPVSMSVSTYTLSAADACKQLVFTNTTAAVITVPSAATIAPAGWRVRIKAQGSGGVTIGTPTTLTMDGAATLVSVPQKSGTEISSDGTNYFTTGASVSH